MFQFDYSAGTRMGSVQRLCGDTSCNLLNRSSKLGHAWASLCNAFAVTPLVIGLNVNFHGFAGG